MKRARSKQLFFEDYVGFFNNLDARALTKDHLNKILSIHGLCRRKIKREVMEDLKELEMMSPKRSTLGDPAAVYPCALLTLEGVKADIRSIGWEECPIGSILAVGSAVEKEAASPACLSHPISTTTATVSSSAAPAPAPAAQLKKKQKGTTKKKRAKMTLALAAQVAVCRTDGDTRECHVR